MFNSDTEASDFWERAAIREFDGGLARPVAERLAWLEVAATRRADPEPQRRAG